TESDFYRELLLGNIEKSNYEDLKDEFISVNKDAYRIIIVKASNDNLKNLSIIIDNIFVFDLNLILDSETIVVITSRKDSEITEMCNFLFGEIYTELSLKTQITIGSKVNKLYNINKSLEDALSIIRLAERFNIKNDICYYEDFLVPLIVDNMNKDLLIKLNKNNSDKYNKIFQNKDLIFTAESFFKNNLNITETSEKIFVHRNTLIYRINKIKEISGFDLRLFDDALKFYIILLIKNMNEK
ncbi:MAG: helix-turn-helix domain-containing protein, partial [Bacillota bacterium]|nr:helix-turn-helix domain-containing protein [Bacillota bacterium]